MSEGFLSGRGQWSGSREQFLHCGLRKFRHSKSSVYRWYPQLVSGWFIYDTYRTMEATRSRHGWVHTFITHRPSVILQLHNFDLFRTCRTSRRSFCTVAWQLARFQLTRRIARSLSDSWASCSFRYRPIHSQKFFWNAKCRLKQANLVSLWHEVEEPSTGTVTVNKKPVLQSFVQVIAEPDSLLVVVNRYGVKEIEAAEYIPSIPNGKWVVEACFVAELGGVVVRISVQLV